jgi:2-isopropylmalate synthase
VSTNVHLFDTTLRDGTQSEGLSLSVDDKLKIAKLLDGFGIDYVEGGYPGSNPKDVEFFKRARSLGLKHARLTAFGMTRKAGGRATSDPILRTLVEAETPTVCVVGKSWTLHVTEVLGTSLDENLAMIGDSISFLKSHGREVVYDAEHFFDGFRASREYALAALKAASDAGADWVVLCDTNGGTLPGQIAEIVGLVRAAIPAKLGIHTHNDSDLAVANALAGVEAGCTQVQGTMNGWGERCGNANLISIIPALQLKMNRRCVPDESLGRLTELSRAVSEIANIRPGAYQPYVGRLAFAHRTPAHADAVQKVAQSYEHLPPDRIGNLRDVSSLEQVRERGQGYQSAAADGSLELAARRSRPGHLPLFDVVDVVVLSERRSGSSTFAEASVKVAVEGQLLHTVSEGDGPVHALDGAFHKVLDPHFPLLKEVRLVDYKVLILDPEAATSAKTRVLIEAARGDERWSTVGVSANIIEASALALADALELPLSRAMDGAKSRSTTR